MFGQIELFAGKVAPRDWEFCEGQLLPVDQNAALSTLLGATFGGDGETNFALPDLRSKAPVSGLNYIICVWGAWPDRP
jgi:microcystin-dependent protein